MKIAILGTNGFLSDRLGIFFSEKKYELYAFGLFPPSSFTYSSFIEANLLDDSFDCAILTHYDIIIYAVGAGIQSDLNEKSDWIYKLNVFVPVKICSALNKLNYKGTFITFGSYFEIGMNVENKLFAENEVLHSSLKVPSDYSISKRMYSRFIDSFNPSFRIWHFILPTIYGETEAEHRLIPYTINSLTNGLPLSFTSGDQIRQYIYVDEIPEIICKALEADLSGGIYNISGIESFKVKDLVHLLADLLQITLSADAFGKAVRTDVGMKILLLDGANLYKKIGYAPRIRIRDVYMKYIGK